MSWWYNRCQPGANVRPTVTENRRSFSICYKMTRELNSDDRFSTEQAEEILLDDENCNYFGMQQIETPDCAENGLPKDIRIDDRPGNCAINEKRVDVEWSRWSTQIVVNTTTKLKLLKTGRITIVESAHGGVDNNRTEKKVYWFRRVYEKQTWSDAIEKCATLGGRLLADLDGTTFQLAILQMRPINQFFQLGNHFGIYQLFEHRLSGSSECIFR